MRKLGFYQVTNEKMDTSEIKAFFIEPWEELISRVKLSGENILGQKQIVKSSHKNAQLPIWNSNYLLKEIC